MIVLLVPPLFSPPVLAALQQGHLITSDECEGLYSVGQVRDVLRVKTPTIKSRSAEILLKHGYQEESAFLSGNQLYSIPQLFSCVG